jgi:hypothetical protein
MVPFCFAHERLLLYVDVHLALFFNGSAFMAVLSYT